MSAVDDNTYSSLLAELDELEQNPESHSSVEIVDWKRRACEHLSAAYAARLNQLQFYESTDLDFDDLPF